MARRVTEATRDALAASGRLGAEARWRKGQPEAEPTRLARAALAKARADLARQHADALAAEAQRLAAEAATTTGAVSA